MNKNGPKIIVAILCLAAAGVAIMWSQGMFDSNAPATGVQPAATNANDAANADAKNSSKSPTDVPIPLKKSTY